MLLYEKECFYILDQYLTFISIVMKGKIIKKQIPAGQTLTYFVEHMRIILRISTLTYIALISHFLRFLPRGSSFNRQLTSTITSYEKKCIQL